jgi:hypothetical protein
MEWHLNFSGAVAHTLPLWATPHALV